ncbi:MAG: YqjF family protein [Candidatus Acidiferrum sp.]
MSGILDVIAHRPWPLPRGPWIMVQTWHDLLFAHWPVPAEALRPHIPARLEIDTFEGQAWMGVVPFRMSGVRLRGTPAVPWLSDFPELNVRTYVVADGKPGVWFFSLDAANPLAVTIARAWFHLPYFRARMNCGERDGWIHYSSERTHRGAPEAFLHGRFRTIRKPFFAKQGTLEHFLTERYCLYASDGRGRILRGEIHHAPWALQLAEAEFTSNSMAETAGFSLPAQEPLLYFSRRQDVLVWQPQRLR